MMFYAGQKTIHWKSTAEKMLQKNTRKFSRDDQQRREGEARWSEHTSETVNDKHRKKKASTTLRRWLDNKNAVLWKLGSGIDGAKILEDKVASTTYHTLILDDRVFVAVCRQMKQFGHVIKDHLMMSIDLILFLYIFIDGEFMVALGRYFQTLRCFYSRKRAKGTPGVGWNRCNNTDPTHMHCKLQELNESVFFQDSLGESRVNKL